MTAGELRNAIEFLRQVEAATDGWRRPPAPADRPRVCRAVALLVSNRDRLQVGLLPARLSRQAVNS